MAVKRVLLLSFFTTGFIIRLAFVDVKKFVFMAIIINITGILEQLFLMMATLTFTLVI